MEKEQIFEALKKSVGEIMNFKDAGAMTYESSLVKMGANSIDRMDILMQTMKTLNIRIPMISFAEAHNLGDIVNILHKA